MRVWYESTNGVNPGDHRWFHLFSMDSYNAGQRVLVAIGIEDNNYVWEDDYIVDAYMTNRWFVKNIVIRSTGAP